MNTINEKTFINELSEGLDIPDSAYEKAEDRYKDLGDWLSRDGSLCQEYFPHIFPQGSFRLGTVNNPHDDKEEFDLDLSCKLEEGISKQNYSQSQLKELVGKEIELYRKARGIVKEVKEKKRCWRLEYADHIKFHMDIVPCIPESDTQRRLIKEAVLLESRNEYLAQSVSELTVAITDNT